MKVIVTKKGASLPTNDWKEGQEISVHENLATDFIKRGIVEGPEEKKEPAESHKHKKKQ